MKQLLPALFDFARMAGFSVVVFFFSHLIELAFGKKTSVFSIVIAGVYFAAAATVCCYFVIGVTDARVLRWYMAAGALCGGIAYRLSVGKLVDFLFCGICALLRRAFAPALALVRAKRREFRLKRERAVAILKEKMASRKDSEDGNQKLKHG